MFAIDGANLLPAPTTPTDTMQQAKMPDELLRPSSTTMQSWATDLIMSEWAVASRAKQPSPVLT
jgi:hypothetical protein